MGVVINMATFQFGESQQGSVLFRFDATGLTRVEQVSNHDVQRLYQLRDLDMLVVYSWLQSFKPVTTLQELGRLHMTMYRLFCVLEHMRWKAQLNTESLLVTSLVMHYLYNDPLPVPSARNIAKMIKKKHRSVCLTASSVANAIDLALEHNHNMIKNNEFESDLVYKVVSRAAQVVTRLSEEYQLSVNTLVQEAVVIDRICFEEISHYLTPCLDWKLESPLLRGALTHDWRHRSLCSHAIFESHTITQQNDLLRIRFMLYPEKVAIYDDDGDESHSIQDVFPELIDHDYDAPALLGHKLFIEKLCGPKIARRIQTRLLQCKIAQDGLV